MNSGDIAEWITNCVWLGYETFSLPLEFLMSRPVTTIVKRKLKFGFFKDEFEIYAVKATDTVLNFSVYRNRQNLYERPDYGYALRFYFTVIDFDEEPQSAIMKGNENMSDPAPAFRVTEGILRKANTIHHVFQLFVVIHMLEFNSLSQNCELKKKIDGCMSFIKQNLSKEGMRHLCFILKSPGLKNTFTGRLPIIYFRSILLVLIKAARNFSSIAEYLRARENRVSENSDLDLSSILKYFGLATDEGPVSPEKANERYLLAHALGLECFKTVASDYLQSILDKEYDVLDVLESSLLVHEKDLFEKAITSFLNRYDEITRSEKFQYLTRCKGIITRLIIHFARVWARNNYIHIPALPPTRELWF